MKGLKDLKVGDEVYEYTRFSGAGFFGTRIIRSVVTDVSASICVRSTGRRRTNALYSMTGHGVGSRRWRIVPAVDGFQWVDDFLIYRGLKLVELRLDTSKRLNSGWQPWFTFAGTGLSGRRGEVWTRERAKSEAMKRVRRNFLKPPRQR